MISPITCNWTVYATACSSWQQRKYQSTASVLYEGNPWWLVDAPHKGPLSWKAVSTYFFFTHFTLSSVLCSAKISSQSYWMMCLFISIRKRNKKCICVVYVRQQQLSKGFGVGVTNMTKAAFVNFSVSKIFDLAKVPVALFESHSYLTGVTTAERIMWYSIANMYFAMLKN